MIKVRIKANLLRLPTRFPEPRLSAERSPALEKVLLCMFALHCCFLLVAGTSHSQEKSVLFREEFRSLDHWKPVFLSKTKRPTKYTIEVDHQGHYLKAESNASASAILHQSVFSVYEFPQIRWQWKIMNVYERGNVGTKAGDNSPLRIYVLFQYDPEKASSIEKAVYHIARFIHGEYPPYAALCYFWASQPTDKGSISTSPHEQRVKMIALQGGTDKIGTWQEERINILDDYRKAFGKEPPPMANIGIMNDSDYTGERSVAYVRLLEVYR